MSSAQVSTSRNVALQPHVTGLVATGDNLASILPRQTQRSISQVLAPPAVNATGGTVTALPITGGIIWTSATTINNLAAGYKGQQVIFYFQNPCTVVDGNSTGGAQLLLAGSANMSATTSSTLSLFYDGASWVETARAIH